MTSPRNVQGWTLLAAGLALAGVVWLTRYQYVGQGSTVVRVNRWTGTTAVLTRSAWRPIASAPVRPPAADPLDSLARSAGVDLSAP